MIKSFRGKLTERFWDGETVKQFSGFKEAALRKLDQLNAAARLEDMAAPPGNRLEALKGDRRGQHSIRINDQYRICFVWTETGIEQVEIVDYH